jgi:hypothetical protein
MYVDLYVEVPIPVAARSNASICGRSLTRIVGSNPTGSMDVCVVFVVRTVAWNVKWHEGRKGLKKQYKNGSKGKTPGQTKKTCIFKCCVLSSREVSVTVWSLVQRSSTECGVSECDREASTVRRLWPNRGCRAIKQYISMYIYIHVSQERLYVTRALFRTNLISCSHKMLITTKKRDF